MANYRTHTLFNLILFLPISALAIYFFFESPLNKIALYGGAFAYGTLYMSPDSDVADKCKLLSLRGILTLPFRPYSKLFAHRGISHWLFIGTLTRILWLILLFTLAYTCIYQHTFSLKPIINFYQNNHLDVHYCVAGLIIADIGHLLLDL